MSGLNSEDQIHQHFRGFPGVSCCPRFRHKAGTVNNSRRKNITTIEKTAETVNLFDHYDLLNEVIEREAAKTARDWHGLVPAEDLAGDVWLKLLEIEKKGRLHRDLRPYGWPASGSPESLPAVVALAARSWTNGVCSAAKADTDVLRYEAEIDTPPTRIEVLDALVAHHLLREDDPRDSLPTWVARIADEIPNLTDGEVKNLSRWVNGERVDKSNVNKAADKLLKLVIRTGAEELSEHDGPGSRSAMSAEYARSFDPYRENSR